MAIKGEVRPSLYVVTDKYGLIESKMAPGFDGDSGAIERKYKIENIPQEVVDVCRVFEGAGARALLVGGCVRDSVISQEHAEMRLKPKDFDLEVYGLSPNELQRVLESHFGADKVDAVGKAFGVIKVRIDGWDEPLDFSCPRIDSKSGQGHKGIDVESRPDMTVKEAAARRDITINSMAYDPLTAIIYDPYGGVDDVKNKIIRMTDRDAFVEDPLRVVRVMQFAARFGFRVEEETENVCNGLVADGFLEMRRNNPQRGEKIFVTERWKERELRKDMSKEEKEEHERTKGLLVIKDGEVVHRKLAEVPEVKGLPAERVAEELYKLLLKGKRPSLGFEFALRIGLIERYWPELAVLNSIEQEYEWHKEGNVWNHSMQVMDAMVEIADRELAEGSIPTPDMWEELKKQVQRFVTEKKKDILQKAYIKELGESEMERISSQATESANLARIKVVREKMTHSPMSEKEMLEVLNKLQEGETEEFSGPIEKWLIDANSIAQGVFVREERRLIEEAISQLPPERLDESRKKKMEDRATEEAEALGREEAVRRGARLRNDVKIVLVLAALCHDLGKATTTKPEDGRIRSKGHEQAGVPPMRRIFETLYETRFSTSIKGQILPLIAEHLKPPEIWRDITGLTEKGQEEEIDGDREDEENDGEGIKEDRAPRNEIAIDDDESETEMERSKKTQLKRRLTRLAYRLSKGDSERSLKGGKKMPVYPDGGGTNLYMLGLLAEADRRGRNPEGRPSTLEELMAKGEIRWKKWWDRKIKELNLDKPVEKILKGEDLMSALKDEGVKGGPWVGVVLNCVEEDAKDGLLTDKQDALQAAVDYYRRLMLHVRAQWEMLPADKKTERELTSIWILLTKTDAREMLEPKKGLP